jgi:hypothetical protein
VSRGPGRVQRFILDRLAAEVDPAAEEVGDYTSRWRWASDLAYECFIGPIPDSPRDWPDRAAQSESIRRACRNLAKAGKVEQGHGYSRFYTGWSEHGDDENWMQAGTDLRVRLPLTPDQAEAEREHDRQRLAEVMEMLGGSSRTGSDG